MTDKVIYKNSEPEFVENGMVEPGVCSTAREFIYIMRTEKWSFERCIEAFELWKKDLRSAMWAEEVIESLNEVKSDPNLKFPVQVSSASVEEQGDEVMVAMQNPDNAKGGVIDEVIKMTSDLNQMIKPQNGMRQRIEPQVEEARRCTLIEKKKECCLFTKTRDGLFTLKKVACLYEKHKLQLTENLIVCMQAFCVAVKEIIEDNCLSKIKIQLNSLIVDLENKINELLLDPSAVKRIQAFLVSSMKRFGEIEEGLKTPEDPGLLKTIKDIWSHKNNVEMVSLLSKVLNEFIKLIIILKDGMSSHKGVIEILREKRKK